MPTNIQRRILRFEEVAASTTFTVPDDWRFLGVVGTGGLTTITNSLAESVVLEDGEPFNMYLPAESIESVEIAAGVGATTKVSYLQ